MKTSITRALIITSGVALIIALGNYWLHHTDAGQKTSARVWGLNTLHYNKMFSELSRRAQRDFERSALSEFKENQPTEPMIKPTSQVSAKPILVTISHHSGYPIHYTLDGSAPTENSPIVKGLVEIDASKDLKARVFIDGRPGSVAQETFIVGPQYVGLNVINLSISPTHLWDKYSGIAANPLQRGRAWERPVNLHVFHPTKGLTYKDEAGLRIHGGASRRSEVPSYRLYFSGQGVWLHGLLDPHLPANSETQESQPLKQWVLKHTGNPEQLFADRLGHALGKKLELITADPLPAVVFVNGNLRGVFDVMQRMSPKHIASKRQVESVEHEHGGIFLESYLAERKNSNWSELVTYVDTHDLKRPEYYAFTKTRLDIPSTLNYFALAMYSADYDRPGHNHDVFREEPSTVWRFGLWDYDGGFNYRGKYLNHDTLAWHLRTAPRPDLKPMGTPDNSTLVASTRFLRGLMRNPEFREKYWKNLTLLLDTALSPEQTNAALTRILFQYAPYRKLEELKFRDLGNPETAYDERVEDIRRFLNQRPQIIRNLMVSN